MSATDSCLLGIDIGTSGLKCVLVDRTGLVLGSAFRAYAPDTPRPGWAEQDPEIWADAALSAVSVVVDRVGVSRASIAGLGFSGQMHSTVCLDKDGRCLRPAMLEFPQEFCRCCGSPPPRSVRSLPGWLRQ